VDGPLLTPPVGDRPPGGHEGLGRHLAAEDPQSVLVGAETPVEVDLEGLQVEPIDQVIEGGGHGSILAARPVVAPPRPLVSSAVAQTLPALREKIRSPMGQKLFRYSMASVVSVIVSNLLLLLFVGVLDLGAVWASTLATGLSAVPSYEMNRKWAWGKSGKSHLMKEVVPFWALAFVGWGFSTIAVWVAEKYAKHHHYSHAHKTELELVVYLGAFGVLWVAKFLIFNSLMFAQHHHEHVHHEDDSTPTAA
jgi:putative flippase GtrA